MGEAARAAAAQQRTKRTHEVKRILAPIGGLNTKDALANMPETDAVILDNAFCQPGWVEIRNGWVLLGTTSTFNVQTLLPYSAINPANNKLYAAGWDGSQGAIYRVDNAGGGAGTLVAGGAGNVVQAIHSAYYDYEQFGTGSAEIIYCLNNTGLDLPLLFDGTSWQTVANAGGTYQLTGGPSANPALLSQVAVYKQRLWFLQGNTMNVYYLPQNVFAGALTLINLAPNFKLGGSIVAMITVSIDNSAGTNDYIAFVSNQGEVIMFQGYDPAAVATFSVSAHFRIGAPIGVGRQCWQKMGMDAAIICQDGLMLLSEAMLTDRSQDKLTLSDKVRLGINQAIAANGTNQGWQLMLYPAGNKLLLTIPTNATQTLSYQYVMSTLTGAWSTWNFNSSGLNYSCIENWNNALYAGRGASVVQADFGYFDNNVTVPTATIQPAWNTLDDPGTRKKAIALEVYLQQPFSGLTNCTVSYLGDFKYSLGSGFFAAPVGSAGTPVDAYILAAGAAKFFGFKFALSVGAGAQFTTYNVIYEKLSPIYGN